MKAKQGVLPGIIPSGLLQAKIVTYDKTPAGAEVTSDCFSCNMTLWGVDGQPHRVGVFAVTSPTLDSVTINIEYRGTRLAYLVLRDDGSYEWYNQKRDR